MCLEEQTAAIEDCFFFPLHFQFVFPCFFFIEHNTFSGEKMLLCVQVYVTA